MRHDYILYLLCFECTLYANLFCLLTYPIVYENINIGEK